MVTFLGLSLTLSFAEQLGAATPWISCAAGIMGAIFPFHAVLVHFRADMLSVVQY